MSKLSINEIKKKLNELSGNDAEQLIMTLEDDTRVSVRKVIDQYKARQKKFSDELVRIYSMKEYERKYQMADYICGIDEVGRGPLCGPVVTCAVILPKDVIIPGVNDSKKLSAKKREELAAVIKDKCIEYSIGMVDSSEIDRINILNATVKAMESAVNSLKHRPQVLLIDALHLPDITDIRQESIVKGDATVFTIAAASIVAKVTRDHMMDEYDRQYPGYGFAKNKGYGTREHIEAIKKLGPCPIHRRTFIKNFL
jgi:ribonuclease HII